MDVLDVANRLRTVVNRGNRVFIGGNGGSFANAVHLVTDLASVSSPCRAGWPVLLLGANAGLFSANSNDGGYSDALARELSVFVAPGDLVLAISTSGKSPNIIALLQESISKGAEAICLTAENGQVGPEFAGTDVIRIGTGSAIAVESQHAYFLGSVAEEIARVHRVASTGRSALFIPVADLFSGVVPSGDQAENRRLEQALLIAEAVVAQGFAVVIVDSQPRSRQSVHQCHASLARHFQVRGIRIDDFSYSLIGLNAPASNDQLTEKIIVRRGFDPARCVVARWSGGDQSGGHPVVQIERNASDENVLRRLTSVLDRM